MRSCPSAVATTSVADSGAAKDDRTSLSVEPSSAGYHATCSPSCSSSSSSPRPCFLMSSTSVAASRAESRVCVPAVTERARSSCAVPCFASITLEDAAACEAAAEADSTAAGLDCIGGGDFPGTTEEKGLLFLGTGVSCALPQLAHVLPIADPNHPFHPFIRVPVEQLPSVATLHQLAAEHQGRQQQQRQPAGDLLRDQQRTHSAAAAAPRLLETQKDLSAGNSYVDAEPFGRPGAEGGSRYRRNSHETFLTLGHKCSEDANSEGKTTVASKCVGAGGSTNSSSRKDQQTGIAANGSNRSERAWSDGNGGRSCSIGTRGGVEVDKTSTEGRCSSIEPSNSSGRGSSSIRDGSCRRRCSGSGGIAEALHKAYPSCQFRCQAGECLQEPLQPAPACVSCFMSWKSARDPNNRGNVCAVLKLGEGKAVLIDCGKTFRQAALAFCPRYGIRSLNAVLLTHDHQDAVGGLDDLRDMQRFCRPPYRKEASPVVEGPAQTQAVAKSADRGKVERTAVAAEDEEYGTREQHGQTLEQGELRSWQREEEGRACPAHREIDKASGPQPRDTLGYRPCYTLNCFLGARTYKTICIRYGYIVEASSHMAAWVAAALEQQQQQKLLQDARDKSETEAAAGVEGDKPVQEERVGAGLLESGSPPCATGRPAECGRENKGPESRTSIATHVGEVDRRDVSVATQQKKMRTLLEAEGGGSSAREICGEDGCASPGDCESTGDYASKQPRAPVCFPCSPLDPGWEQAPVFERKVACLAFHLLSDKAPPSTTTAIAGTEETARRQQQDADALLSSCSKRAASPIPSGVSVSQAAGEEKVTKASLPERAREIASAALSAEFLKSPNACRSDRLEEQNETSRTETVPKSADAVVGEGTRGSVAEKRLFREGKSLVSANGAVAAINPDATGFCEVRIPGTNTTLVSFPVFHGGTYVCLGYVIGSREKLVYMSDVKKIPSAVLERLKNIGNLHTLVIDALSEKLHNSHFSVQEALTVAVELQPREVYFVGMTCTLEHSQTNRRLRCWLQRHQESYRSFHGGRESRLSRVALAFDGMFLPINF